MNTMLLNKRYEIQGDIEVTTLNTVMLALDHHDGRRCVVKVVNHHNCSAERHSDACISLAVERRMLRVLGELKLSVPRLVDFFHVHRRPYLILRLVPGATLQSLFDRGRLSSRDALAALVQVCDVLDAVHDLGYVHQDVKPVNIMLRSDGRAVLIDWGSVQPLNPQATNSYSFTRGFASPEQMAGKVSVSNDIYALGRTLENLIPYPSNRVQRIIDNATAPPSERYRTIRELRTALERLHIAERLVRPLGITMLRA